MQSYASPDKAQISQVQVNIINIAWQKASQKGYDAVSLKAWVNSSQSQMFDVQWHLRQLNAKAATMPHPLNILK